MIATTAEAIRWTVRSRHLRTARVDGRGGGRAHRLLLGASTTMLAVDGLLLAGALLLVG